jgi:hypothetical protein
VGFTAALMHAVASLLQLRELKYGVLLGNGLCWQQLLACCSSCCERLQGTGKLVV